MKITAIKYQSLSDLVLQATGSVEGLVAFAVANEKSITHIPEPGEVFKVPEGLPVNIDIRDYYAAKNIKPVSGVAAATGATQFFIANGFIDFGFTE